LDAKEKVSLLKQARDYFRLGSCYTRAEIHGKFGGNARSGFSISKKYPVIFVFTSEEGKAYGYEDGWMGDNHLHIAGEGQRGDMKFTRGNKAIRDHVKDGRILLYFQGVGEKKRIFSGELRLVDYYPKPLPDKSGKLREGIMFRFKKVEDIKLAKELPDEEKIISQENRKEREVYNLPIDELKGRAAKADPNPLPVETKSRYYPRDPYVSAYVKQRANGKCDLCGQDAPFKTKGGEPFLESHHIVARADGGPDVINNAVALCPNCHKKMHHLKLEEDKQILREKAKE